MVAKTRLWEGQYGTIHSDLELPGTFRVFDFLRLILFDGPWHGKACSEFEKDFHIFTRVLTCSRIFSQRKNFSSKKIRSLSENIYGFAYFIVYSVGRCQRYTLFALTLVGGLGGWKFMWNVIYLPFLTFSWNFCKMFQRIWHRSSIMENRVNVKSGNKNLFLKHNFEFSMSQLWALSVGDTTSVTHSIIELPCHLWNSLKPFAKRWGKNWNDSNIFGKKENFCCGRVFCIVDHLLEKLSNKWFCWFRFHAFIARPKHMLTKYFDTGVHVVFHLLF